MLGRMRTALKFMTYGLVIGLLFAPGSGRETRENLKNWIMSSTKGVTGSNS